MTTVYRPFSCPELLLFFQELNQFRAAHPGPWAVTGDFNLIYKAEDKNNQNFDRRWMARFRRFLDDLELAELNLHGRRYTWSNERREPTLVRLDRWFYSVDWEERHPNCLLRAGSSAGSDHCPIILHSNIQAPRYHRFRFEPIWPKFDDGYLQIISEAWVAPDNLNPLRRLHLLLTRTARALQSWNDRRIGSVFASSCSSPRS